jgi:GTP cyclohydrolase FolE2
VTGLPEQLAALARSVTGPVAGAADRSWPRNSSAVWEITGAAGTRATAALGASQRGVQLSRLIESVQEVSSAVWPDLDTLIRTLVQDVARRQDLGRARVKFEGVAQVDRQVPVSGRRSLDHWECIPGEITT